MDNHVCETFTFMSEIKYVTINTLKSQEHEKEIHVFDEIIFHKYFRFDNA